MFEDGLFENPPRAARVYALIAISFFDSFIASQDGKFTYWYIRPSQLDASIVPLFPVPPFPSYTSNHSTFSATRSQILAYLFPLHADEVLALGKELAIPESGQAFTFHKIMSPAPNWERRLRASLSPGLKQMARNSTSAPSSSAPSRS
jgi:hypothetical protein